MRKFFIFAFLIFSSTFISAVLSISFDKSNIANAGSKNYSDEQLTEYFSDRIEVVENTDVGLVFQWYRSDSNVLFLKAGECYKSSSGLIYSVSKIYAKNGISYYTAVSQIDLDSNSIRWVKVYFSQNMNFGGAVKTEKYIHSWQKSSAVTEYCDYLRKNYNEINGV